MTFDAPDAYIICSNPRSGTTLLCDMLRQTKVAGAPDSFFRQQSIQDWALDWDITDGPGFDDRYFAALLHAGKDNTRVFGMRLLGPDLKFACDWLKDRFPDATTDRSAFARAFGQVRYIHLSRQDKLAEAVSYIRAEQTGVWHRNSDGSVLEEIAPNGANGYDAEAIETRMEILHRFDTEWNTWFDAQEITPLRLSYEALAADPQAALEQVLATIGQDPNLAKSVQPGLRKLADQVNLDWIKRFRSTDRIA